MISVITVNFNQTALTLDLLQSCQQWEGQELECIVVDNASEENPTERILSQFPEVSVLVQTDNRGYAAGLNIGMQAARGDYFLLLNNDTLVTANMLDHLLAVFQEQADVGIVSPKICYANQPNRVQYAGMTLLHPITGRNRMIGHQQIEAGHWNHRSQTGYAHGAAMMLSRESWETVGPMDESYFLYYEELDWSARFRKAGYSIWCEGKTKILHRVSASVGEGNPIKSFYYYRNRRKFMRSHQTAFSYSLFLVYSFVIMYPLALLRHFRKPAHLRAIIQSMFAPTNRLPQQGQ
ncbi:MAG: glycosyltransferase family 2 protein [Bacteroidota bacterium]